MQAVIKTGGKQYSVAVGDKLSVESLPVEPGEIIEFKDVLLLASGTVVTVGKPLVLGAVVIWDSWRLEGPSFVWSFRGTPHVHVWVNIASDAGVKLNS